MRLTTKVLAICLATMSYHSSLVAGGCPFFSDTSAPSVVRMTPSSASNNATDAAITSVDGGASAQSADFLRYDDLSAAAKLGYIWRHLLVNQTTADNTPLTSGLIFTEGMEPTVDFVSDFVPLDRKKAVHGQGVVCQIRLDIPPNPQNPYTGILRSGSSFGVARVSSVLDPTFVGGPVPSIALKFFKDGNPSANFVALNSEAPQTDTSNPFAVPFTNQFVALPTNIEQVFLTVSRYPNFTGCSDLGWVGNPATSTEHVYAPWQIILVPNPLVQQMLPLHYPYNTGAEYYEQMLFPYLNVRDLLLYYVYTVDKPQGTSSFLGTITATTNFFRSDFGDRVLFFKHTTAETDIALRPELGVLCPEQSATCQPCPQTYDCRCEHWMSHISPNPNYNKYYEPSVMAQRMLPSAVFAAAFGNASLFQH